MAIDFSNAANTALVNHGSAAALDNLGGTSFTVWAWVYRTGAGGNQMIMTKDNSYPSGWGFIADNFTGDGQLRMVVFCGTNGTQWADAYSTVATGIATNTWTFVAAVCQAATPNVKLYTGTLAATVSECAYGQQQNSSTSYSPDASASVYVGNLQRSVTLPFKGSIPRGGLVTRALTLGELKALQFASIGQANIASTQLLFDYHNSGATQPDYSGKGNNGTPSGAVANAAHVPLPAPWGWQDSITYIVAVAAAIDIAALFGVYRDADADVADEWETGDERGDWLSLFQASPVTSVETLLAPPPLADVEPTEEWEPEDERGDWNANLQSTPVTLVEGLSTPALADVEPVEEWDLEDEHGDWNANLQATPATQVETLPLADADDPADEWDTDDAPAADPTTLLTTGLAIETLAFLPSEDPHDEDRELEDESPAWNANLQAVPVTTVELLPVAEVEAENEDALDDRETPAPDPNQYVSALVTKTATFTIAAATDDGRAYGIANAPYPPAVTAASDSDNGFTLDRATYDSGVSFTVTVGLFRWDTSSLGALATVVSATLKLWSTGNSNPDSRSVTVGWYAGSNWPIDTADYTNTAETDAHAGTPIGSVATGAYTSFVLLSPATVNVTGYTGLRVHISGGSPASFNYISPETFEGPAGHRAQLVVTYTAPDGPEIYAPAVAALADVEPTEDWEPEDEHGDWMALLQASPVTQVSTLAIAEVEDATEDAIDDTETPVDPNPLLPTGIAIETLAFLPSEEAADEDRELEDEHGDWNANLQANPVTRVEALLIAEVEAENEDALDDVETPAPDPSGFVAPVILTQIETLTTVDHELDEPDGTPDLDVNDVPVDLLVPPVPTTLIEGLASVEPEMPADDDPIDDEPLVMPPSAISTVVELLTALAEIDPADDELLTPEERSDWGPWEISLPLTQIEAVLAAAGYAAIDPDALDEPLDPDESPPAIIVYFVEHTVGIGRLTMSVGTVRPANIPGGGTVIRAWTPQPGTVRRRIDP